MSRRAQLERLLEADPQDPFLNYSLAMELQKEEAFDEALARFEHVLELDAQYVAAYKQKSRLLIKLGRHADARATLTTGIEAARAGGDQHAADDLQQLLDTLQAT